MTEQIYSSVCIGDGAVGKATLFDRPQGVEIPFLGSGERTENRKVFSSATTNVMKASESVGVLVEDLLISRIWVEVDDPSALGLLERVRVQIRVDGLKLLQERCPASTMLGPGFVLSMPLFLKRTSLLEAEVTIEEPLKVEGSQFLLTLKMKCSPVTP